MSAICGIFYRDRRPFELESLRAMMNALAHHGKDGSGVWNGEHLGLGHQKLQITPESFYEHLPFRSPCHRMVVTADARIDNRDELFNKLGLSPGNETNTPDAHLILYAYEKWGETCPEHLEGSYTFAIWDERSRHLFCAVDALCSKCLYTYCTPQFFIFSTELKGILALPELHFQLDDAGFAQQAFLPKAYRDPQATSFKGIKLMRAATTCIVTASTMHTNTYWEPDFEREIRLKNEGEYVERFRELFFHSVRSCIRTNFPVGALLSGGLDSSSIVCTVARLQRERGKTLTGISSVLPEDYSGPESDERHYIDIVKRQENIAVHYVHPPVKSLCGYMNKSIEQSENPRYYHTYFLSSAFQEVARKDNIRVLLCGSRGEIGPSSPGNGYVPELAVEGHWARLVATLREMAKVENTSFFNAAWQNLITQLLPENIAHFYARVRGRRPVSFAEALIAQPDFFYQTMASAGITPPDFVETHFKTFPNQKKTAFALFKNTSIPFLSSTMPEEQEVFFPFANKRLIEFCLALPADMKIRHGWKRYMIRAGMEGILPPEIQWRTSKKAFSPDFFRRVEASRHDALLAFEEIESDNGLYNYLRTYIDLSKLKGYAQSASSCGNWGGWKGFDSFWQIVLRGLNVAFFLKWAKEKMQR
ncbi:MAG: hypothetical protein HQM08_13865 [Candidatus Riflebacteria bacterium]|nr:hypothetical protein [Candidatus Riflebacteria bacterium]